LQQYLERHTCKLQTPEKPIRGFEVTGIWPYNRTVFKPEDFAAANVTEEDIPAEPTTSSSMLEAPPSAGNQCLQPAAVSTVSVAPAEPTTSLSLLEAPPSSGDRQLEPAVVAVSLLDESVSVASSSQHIRSLINKLSPPPKSTVPRVRKRKAESAALVTGSPFKKMLEEKEKEKERKISVKKTASSKSQKKKQSKPANNTATKQKRQQQKKMKAKKRLTEDEVWICSSCHMQYGSSSDPKVTEDWVQCGTCLKTFHISCGRTVASLMMEMCLCARTVSDNAVHFMFLPRFLAVLGLCHIFEQHAILWHGVAY